MSHKVIWSPLAKLTIQENIDYLATQWDSKTLLKFIKQVEAVIEKIERNPLSYPPHKEKGNVRKCKVNKRITIYYKVVDNERIELVTFWNSYKHPDNLKL